MIYFSVVSGDTDTLPGCKEIKTEIDDSEITVNVDPLNILNLDLKVEEPFYTEDSLEPDSHQLVKGEQQGKLFVFVSM